MWIVVTVLAASFQVVRNALQRSLAPAAGPWGATLVRFLFGLPFSIALGVVAMVATPQARPQLSVTFWILALGGGLSQLVATAALLAAMRRGGFAVGTALQQSSLPLAAVLGWIVFGERLDATAWAGVAVTSTALGVLSWPRDATGPQPRSGAAFGLLSGLLFGLSLNAFRQAGLALEPRHRVYAAVLSVSLVQAAQAAGLTLALAVLDRRSLHAVFADPRRSFGAGLFGALASTGWFTAVALAPAGPVRAVGTIEAPIAALAARRLFAERVAPWRLAAGSVALAGVVMTSLG